jgi:HAD superfamily hydrolase (TIGR01490 family)
MIQSETISDRNRELVFVDLDRCLLREDSIRVVVSELLRRRILSRSLVLTGSVVYLQYRLNLRDPEVLVRYAIRRLAGTPYPLIEEISYDVYHRHLRNRFHPLLLRELESHLKEGRPVFLLTGGLPPIPQLVGRELGLSGVFATTPELSGGVFTGRILEPPCVGKGKVVHAQRAAKRAGGVLSQAWFYTDSSSDLPLLRIVRHPVAVTPDPLLSFVARRRGWRILREGERV